MARLFFQPSQHSSTHYLTVDVTLRWHQFYSEVSWWHSRRKPVEFDLLPSGTRGGALRPNVPMHMPSLLSRTTYSQFNSASAPPEDVKQQSTQPGDSRSPCRSDTVW